MNCHHHYAGCVRDTHNERGDADYQQKGTSQPNPDLFHVTSVASVTSDCNGWKAVVYFRSLRDSGPFASLSDIGGGFKMALWSIGLATRASAERACKWGGLACLFQVARATLGNIASVSVTNNSLDNAIAYFIGASLLPLLLLVAGIRLWRHRSWAWGTLASLLVGIDLVVVLAAPTAWATDAYLPLMTGLTARPLVAAQTAVVAGIVIKVAILALVANGARGAFALRTIECPTEMRGALS
jgi:hypothetical protein